MLLLNIFCAECAPYLLLMLAGAWGLGWFFWKLLKGDGYVSTIKDLNEEINTSQKENLDLKTEITQAKYEVEKSEEDITNLRRKLGDFELQEKVHEEKLFAIQSDYENLRKKYEGQGA